MKRVLTLSEEDDCDDLSKEMSLFDMAYWLAIAVFLILIIANLVAATVIP
jgi:hypothetical protein